MSGIVSSGQRSRVDVPTKRRKPGQGPIKRHHWFHVVVMVCGWIMPPIAVLIRFGVGWDLLVNIICTAAAYIPGHFHNFWIQNIRNNNNAKHSPKWAVKAGLVKDYNKSKLKKRGWAGRYDDDGIAIGGKSYHGQKRWDEQEVIVDPLTGETKKVAKPQSRDSTSLPSPWADDPLREEDTADGAARDYDDADDGPEDAARVNYASHSKPDHLRRAPNGNSSSGSKVDNRKRDSVTGAIIDEAMGSHDDAYDLGPRRSPSGRSLHSQYAERYHLGGARGGKAGSSVSLNIKKQRSHNASRDSFGAAVAPGEELPQQRKKGGFAGIFGGGGGKKNKNGGRSTTAEGVNGRQESFYTPYGGSNNQLTGLPPGGAFGNDDNLDRELQDVHRSAGHSTASAYGSGLQKGSAVPASNGYSQGPAQVQKDYSISSVGGDGLNHQF
ncbi:hypothetical protein K437DRAFT_255863 [Tilletiaria anomala UBC 951]|uniref:Uncharacterized protein n=1 Tax=Tilletiaria anomala (strain ATCC 24038 / CBS 436.72 / UBC 951) TaxID=1037660 RepID=A0A066W996_TILAU|nr:uncharacterized protein K437DRAFT_255863 [Tilletiaria anomala UBC 951]KDN47325.1 hypothetical protein K437DRAFT_255863 [Tilletiaria anomala UBC 951]